MVLLGIDLLQLRDSWKSALNADDSAIDTTARSDAESSSDESGKNDGFLNSIQEDDEPLEF